MAIKQLIIDVREPFEYDIEHAQGAINIPPSEIMSGASQLEGVSKDTQLVLYCKSGARSNSAMRFFRQLGYNNLVNGINSAHVTKNYLS